MTVSAEDITFLRVMLDDPDEGSPHKVMLDADTIESLLERHDNNMFAAAAVGWAIKAGLYAKQIDFSSEGNTARPYSQLFRNAAMLAKQYRDMAGDMVLSPDAVVGTARIAGKSINLRENTIMYEVLALVEPEEA
jgi:hypothetical protein